MDAHRRLTDPNGTKRLAIPWILIGLTLFSGVTHAGDIDVAALEARLQPAIEQAIIEGKIPSMTIALVAGDEVIWTGAYGHSNLWARTPAVPSTVYLIGSTFKAMSMFALLQQMEQGKFSLDDPVNNYLREFKIRGVSASDPVIFRHLLTHVSGLPGGYGPHRVWGDTVPPPLTEYLSTALEVKRPPLEKVEYSNPAYTLLGYLVGEFSGMDYKAYMQEHIFDPLQMDDTAFEPRPDMQERLAIPYELNPETGRAQPADRTKANVWPAGIVYGTVLDQANWLIANLNGGVFKGHRLIGEEMLNEVMTRQHDKFNGPLGGDWLNDTTGYGLTWWISQHEGETLFAHSGSVPGYTAWLLGNRDRKLGVAILTNGHRAHPHLSKLSMQAMALMKEPAP